MAEAQTRPNSDDEPDAPGGTDATLDGTHEPTFPQLDVDGSEDGDDE